MRYLEKVLNIADHEFPRTFYAWALLFLHKLGYIIGTTILIAMFVTQFGINSLPFMVLVQAALTIGGMFAFSFLNDHFNSKKLITASAFATGILLFVSTFFTNQPFIFFPILLTVTGIFLPQVTIFISNYIEDFFTPLECERTFPVIESAQTIGGIFAGLLITTLSSYIASYKFYYLWILFLFLVVSVVMFLEPFSAEHNDMFHKQEESRKDFRARVKKIKDSINEIKLVPFLQGLLIIFLLQWTIAYVLEFQYTKFIDQNVATTTSIGAHEQSLAHGLGSFEMLFFASALVVQLLAASRIIRKLGTVGSILLHSLVTFFSAVSLLLGFGYFTVILAKNNFEVSGVIHDNAYEGSYYALRHGSQRQVREFFEAFISPLGTIFGTLLVVTAQFLFLDQNMYMALELLLVVLSAGMIIFSLRLQKSYTKLSKENLLKSEHRLSKFHAIEILSQNGHKNHLPALIQALKNPNESPDVKVKILDIFYKLKDPKTIPVLIEFLKSPDEEVVFASVHALGIFSDLGEKIFDQAFSRFRVIEELKNLFEQTKSEKVQEAVIYTLANLHYEDIVPFLLKAIDGASLNFQVACIRVCSLFHDPLLCDYLLPFLKSHSPFVRAETVRALWQFPLIRRKLRKQLDALAQSSKREDFLAYSTVIGDVGNKADQQMLLSRFNVFDPVLKFTVASALFKLGYQDAAQALVHLLFSRNLLVLEKAKELFVSLNQEQKKVLQNMAKREVSRQLQPFFVASGKDIQSPVLQNMFKKCHDTYLLLDLRNEAEHIQSVFEAPSLPLQSF